MIIQNMTKEDFAQVRYINTLLEWDKITKDDKLSFNSLVIMPVENEQGVLNLHDSGYGCMEFCLVNENQEPIGRIGGGSDVINLDGIGGYGYDWLNRCARIPDTIPVHGWSIDLLPCGYLRLWASKSLFIDEKFILSSLVVYAEDAKRGGNIR